MSDGGELKYRWTPESTTLLVSVWTDKQVQKQLEYSSKPQLIWESVARYMNKKGYNVNGKQCRSRMKQVLVCYREAKRAGTKAGVEQYYESIDRVLKFKRLEQTNHHNNNNGIDTVDSVVNVKSPPKEMKTNKNLQMRYKYQQPAEFRTEALSPVWSAGSENYPDSPESSETVLAQPFRVFSPVRDAATNTTQQQLINTNKKILQQNLVIEEAPIKETYRQGTTYTSNYFNDIPFQNTVQNVQNQIIQENMQQNQAILHQNMMQNQVLEQNRLQMNANVLRQNIQNANQGLYSDQGMAYCQGQMAQMNLGQQNIIAENVMRMQQNNCQLNSINNRAMPQEPRKNNFRQNLAATHRQFQDIGMQNYNPNMNHIGFLSPSISPDIPPNLNEAFCQQKNDKANGINEPYVQTTANQLNSANPDVTTVTNNATFNDDTISIEFLQDSPSLDEEPVKLKDFAVNTEEIPNAPLRKKKAEKLERLMINAINSQTEVVNKILAAQNDMVSRVLDLDRDRQNRLETRIDHLLDVMQTAVLNKSGGSDRNSEVQAHAEPLITNLLPPPKPGVVPPKLDLVPPKPCRVPCTGSACTNQPINTVTTTAPPMTRPGVVSPIMSPSRRVGAIWQKLGPVSTSPFVRAQQQLGFKPVNPVNNDVRTQSSAERRITKECETGMDTKTLIFETANFLEAERHLQEEVENARIKASINQDLQSRRRLFTQREPNAAMILTAAFLDAEIQSAEIYESARQNWLRQRQFEEQVQARAKLAEQRDNYNVNNFAKRNGNDDILLAGQGDSYERLKHLHGGRDRVLGDSRDSSTPAKVAPAQKRDMVEVNEPRQTIQQLAQLVMNSARWRNTAGENHGIHRRDLNLRPGNTQTKPTCPMEDQVPLRDVPKESMPDNRDQFANKQQVDGKVKTIEWLQERFSYGGQPSSNVQNGVAQAIVNRFSYNEQPKPPRTMGFTTDFLNNEENNNAVNPRKQMPVDPEKRVGFVFDNEVNKERFTHDEKDPFEELHQFYIQKQLKLQQEQGIPFILQNGKVILPQSDVIERYVQESKTKQTKDTDSDNDEEFMDTTMTMPNSRKSSLTSSSSKQNCVIS